MNEAEKFVHDRAIKHHANSFILQTILYDSRTHSDTVRIIHGYGYPVLRPWVTRHQNTPSDVLVDIIQRDGGVYVNHHIFSHPNLTEVWIPHLQRFRIHIRVFP